MKKLTFILSVLLMSALQIHAQTKEYLAPGSLKLNGKVILPGKLSDAVKKLGAVTYKNPEALECGSFFVREGVESHVVRIKGIDLEKNKEDIFLHSLDLTKSPDVFLTYPGGRIDRTTTLQQLREKFPQSAKQIEGNKSNDTFWIELKADSEEVFKFDFKNGKLIRISYWGVC